jgi:hypothetical protein
MSADYAASVGCLHAVSKVVAFAARFGAPTHQAPVASCELSILLTFAVNHKSIEHVSLPIIWMRRVCGCGGRKTRGRCLLLGPVRKGQLLLCDIIKCA